MTTVALDARLTRQMSVGMKAYVRELVPRVPRQAPDMEFIIFSNERLEISGENSRREPVDDRSAANGGIGEQFLYPRHLAASRASLVHYMSVYSPRSCRLPHISTIHDLIHLRFPHYFSWKVPPYYDFIVKPVARTARFVITDARATSGDLQAYLGVEASRVRVVPLGVASEFHIREEDRAVRALEARRHFEIGAPYFIYAGNHRPHKNLITLVDAWRRTQRACDLVLTEEGDFGFPLDRGEKSNGRIVTVGHVTQDELIALYAGCSAAIQPSLYEGFGLGVLEAMAAGAPVIIAQTPSLLELVGNAGLTFPPSDARALAGLMDLMLQDPAVANALRSGGRKRAQDFTWDETARLTAQVYREALEC